MMKHRKIREVEECLNPYIEYLNTFEQKHSKVTKLSELGDGLHLYELIKYIEYFQFVGPIELNPLTFSHKFSNLKTIMKSIERFWQVRLGFELESEEIDLVQIANHGKVEQVEKFVDLFVRTAIQSYNKSFFIQKILVTSESTQEYLKRIVQKTIGRQSTQSPRKLKVNRMHDKLMELEHENDKLQAIISEICEEKYEFDQKYKAAVDKIQEKDHQIQQLNQLLGESTMTPQKKRKSFNIPDTSEKQQIIIQSLKNSLCEMEAFHEKERENFKKERDHYAHRLEKLADLEHEIELYKEMEEDRKESMKQHSELQRILVKMDFLGKQKDEHIEKLNEKVERDKQRLLKLEKIQVENRIELSKKDAQLEELQNRIHLFQGKKDLKDQEGFCLNKNTLFSECPQVIDHQNQVLLQNNKHLRGELDRTSRKLKIVQEELQKHKKQLTQLAEYQKQNKKLSEIISDLGSHRGEENQILVGVIYEMRRMMRTMEKALKQKKQEKPLQSIQNRAYGISSKTMK